MIDLTDCKKIIEIKKIYEPPSLTLISIDKMNPNQIKCTIKLLTLRLNEINNKLRAVQEKMSELEKIIKKNHLSFYVF